MAWNGNYERSDRRSRFVPANEPAKLVTPQMAFVSDAYGGFGTPSVDGRHDVLADRCPEWFRERIEALAQQSAGVQVAALRVGSAGKYRFWTAPCATAQEWEALSTKLVEEQNARIAATRAEGAAFIERQNRKYREAQLADQRLTVALELGPTPYGRAIAVTEDGHEVLLGGGCLARSDWLPSARPDLSNCADAQWWADWSAADIEAARATKAAKKAACAL